jgi:hypothetical protein
MSGIFSYLFGIAKSYNIHNLSYYIVVQVSTDRQTNLSRLIGGQGSRGSRPNHRLAWSRHGDEQLVREEETRPHFRPVELAHEHRQHFR